MDVMEKSSNGKRLIDANKIINDIGLYMAENSYLNDTPLDILKMVADWIKCSQTVDAVEVIRCRECRYWGDGDGKLQRSDGVLYARCTVHNYLIDGRYTGWCPTENDFCSYGERKDDIEN